MIVFFDIPCKVAGRAWSPNTWRVRYALNYKRIPYRTEWVEFPDIEPLAKAKRIPATAIQKDGTALYTLPAIFDPYTQRYVSDSALIVKYLDSAYPDTPKVFPPGTRALQAAFQSAFVPKIMPLSTVIVPYVTDNLNEKSRPFFQSDREKKFGKTMEELKTNLEERQMNWEKFKDGMGRIDGWFTKNDEEGLYKSDFIMGDQPIFADFVIGGLLAWIRNVWGKTARSGTR